MNSERLIAALLCLMTIELFSTVSRLPKKYNKNYDLPDLLHSLLMIGVEHLELLLEFRQAKVRDTELIANEMSSVSAG